ncbi:hypothetical protein [Streptomyces sp. NPDC012888]|uniref:hypothetical protein n=1 Tax=Streptomyces sp. NPDC012888 TaxID=3364855 RepID=UPI0036B1715B
MRNTLVRRSVMSASAVSLALLVTACGGSGDAGKDAPKGDAKASASAPAASDAKGKTDAELAPLLVTTTELADHKFEEVTAEEVKTGSEATSDKADCKPLVQAQYFGKVGTATGAARTKLTAVPKSPGADASPEEKAKAAMGALGSTVTGITLTSYDGDGAAEAFASVKKAGTACAAGYTATAAGTPVKIGSVAAGPSVTAGDEAAAYTVMMGEGDEKITTHVVAVRKGNTLATFSSISLTGTAEQPKVVIEAQAKKLG